MKSRNYRGSGCRITIDSTSGGTVAIIYRPLSSSAATIAEFHDELSEMFDRLANVIDTDRFVACDDLNCGGDSPISISTDLQTLFNMHGLQQFVQSPMRRTVKVSNLLDLVVGRVGLNCISEVAVAYTRRTVHPTTTSSAGSCQRGQSRPVNRSASDFGQ